MKRSWVEKEGREWVQEGIISEEQYQSIISRYSNRQSRGLLAVFGGLFIGLGFLTFVASNWSMMPNELKMFILIGAMIGFYSVGERFYQRGSRSVGVSFYAIGVLLFGAAVILTGQMYHYMAFSARSFLLWGLAGFLVYLVRRELALFFLTLVLFTVGQIYSGLTYGEAHLGILLVFLVGCGIEVVRLKKESVSLLFGFGVIVQSLVFVFASQLDSVWLLFIWLLIYVATNVIKGRFSSLRTLLIIAPFTMKVIEVFILGSWRVENVEINLVYLAGMLGLGTLMLVMGKDRVLVALHLLLFFPVAYIGEGANVAAMVILYILSIGYLVKGTKQEEIHLVNYGIVAFLVSTFVAYVQLAWDFLDKSIFFFIGGVLLFGLSYLLNRERRRLSADQKGGRSS